MDPRTRHVRRLRRLRFSARRWSMVTGTLAGTTLVLVPYRGIGWPDAVWAGLTGLTATLTWWRWADLRALTALPVPEPMDPLLAASAAQARLEAAIGRLPVGAGFLAEVRRVRSRARVRGSAVARSWDRLERAATTLRGLAPRLGGSASTAAGEAVAAERTLRELGERAAAVERAIAITPEDQTLGQAHAELVERFTTGVGAYEQLVGAAAGYVAQDGQVSGEAGAIQRLIDATDLLRGTADGLSELKSATDPPS